MVKAYLFPLTLFLLGSACTEPGEDRPCNEEYEVVEVDDGDTVSMVYFCGGYDPTSADHRERLGLGADEETVVEEVVVEQTGTSDESLAAMCAEAFRALGLHQEATAKSGTIALEKAKNFYRIQQQIAEPERAKEIAQWYSTPVPRDRITQLALHFDDPDWRKDVETECGVVEHRYGRKQKTN